MRFSHLDLGDAHPGYESRRSGDDPHSHIVTRGNPPPPHHHHLAGRPEHTLHNAAINFAWHQLAGRPVETYQFGKCLYANLGSVPATARVIMFVPSPGGATESGNIDFNGLHGVTTSGVWSRSQRRWIVGRR